MPLFGDEFMKKEEINDLPELVREYILTYLVAIKNKSQLTVLEYASDLRSFLRYRMIQKGLVSSDANFESISVKNADDGLILNATKDDVYEFISYCATERRNNENTRSRKISSIKSFYKWLANEKEILQDNPMDSLESPKHKKSLPKYLTLDESKNLLRHIDGPNKERDYCIITFFLNCGMRLSELVSLNYTDIKSDNSMKVTGKGNKERIVYLNEACISAFNEYMKVRPADGVKDKNALFLSNRKTRISPKTVQHIVYSLLEKSGLGGQGFSTHKLRHTAATLMYQHGNVDVMLIKEMLGHEDLSTTEIYTHVVSSQLKEAATHNPLAGEHLSKENSENKKSDE